MKSKTHENIINAYRGEISGELLYLFLSEKFIFEGNEKLGEIFKQLSKEEKGHANVLKQYIKGDVSQYDLSIEEIEKLKNHLNNPLQSLELFAAGEKKAGEEIYPYFSQVAAQEGYEDIAKMFLTLAKVELKHGKQLEEIIGK